MIFEHQGEVGPLTEAPRLGEGLGYLDVLPESGREVLVLGDPAGCREFNHPQGDNPYGFKGTCGLVSCEDVLRQFGLAVSEADVVHYAATNGLCETRGRPESCGGTTEYSQAQILSDLGVPAHVERGRGLAELAGYAFEGRGVIVEVNAGLLWNDANSLGDPQQANHAVVVTGAACDPSTGELLGFYVNDNGRGYPGDSGRFVSAERMQQAWVEAGGRCVVTDLVRR